MSIGRRPPLVPLTKATIAYNDHEGLQVHDVGTLIFNRDLAEWVRADPGDLAAFEGVRVVTSAG